MTSESDWLMRWDGRREMQNKAADCFYTIQKLVSGKRYILWCGFVGDCVTAPPSFDALLISNSYNKQKFKEWKEDWFVRLLCWLQTAGICEQTEKWQLHSVDISWDRTLDSELSHHSNTQVRQRFSLGLQLALYTHIMDYTSPITFQAFHCSQLFL